ncbi:MAG: hypothetical protein ABIL06_11750 [Pseudomonadota bacterium]
MTCRKNSSKNVRWFITLIVLAIGFTIAVNSTILKTEVKFDQIEKSPLKSIELQKELISLMKDIANKYITWSTVILGFIVLNCFIKSENKSLLSGNKSFLIPVIFVFLSASLFYGLSMINELAKLVDKGKLIAIPMKAAEKTDLVRNWDLTVGWFSLGFILFVAYLFLFITNALKED